MFATLLASRRFLPLFIVQFFSALNDNFVKTALAMLVLYRLGGEGHGEGGVGTYIALASAALVVPFFFLSALGGELADKFDKAWVCRRLKLAEIPVAALAGIGFIAHSPVLLLTSILGYGIIAALFGPIKYGILPDHLKTEELSAGNALVEGATFAAILIGTIAGGEAATVDAANWIVLPAVLVFAALCVAAAYAIPSTGKGDATITINRNPLTSTFHLLGELRADRPSWIGGLIVSWFWLVGIVVLTLLPQMVKDRLNGAPEVINLALGVFTVGIAAGSVAAARLSKLRPNLALVPAGALLMALFGADLAFSLVAGTAPGALGPLVTIRGLLATVTGWRFAIDLVGLAFAGGLYVVPSFASIQAGAEEHHRARVVAGVNVLNAAFMTAGTIAIILLDKLGISMSGVLGLTAIGNVVAAVLVLRAWGRQGVQDFAMLIFKTAYGLEVRGMENLPPKGTPTIIAPNHTSFLDGPVMHAILPSHASFAVDTGIAQAWWVQPFLKLINAHTMDPTKPFATRDLINIVKSGETLVIFPEGRLTVTTGLMKIYEGTGLIADKSGAMVVPVRIDGLDRTPFSYLRRTQLSKIGFPKVRVTFLPARKLSVDPAITGRERRRAAGMALTDVMVESAVANAPIDRTLFQALVCAKTEKDVGAVMIEDPLRTRLTYKKLITGAQVLGQKLEPLASVGQAVGVLLPNTAGVVVVFYALQAIGRVPAMLNYTAGPANVAAACKTAKVATVLTSRAFIDKGRLGDLVKRLEGEGVKLVYLEDVRATVTLADKMRGLLAGGRTSTLRKATDPAVILFTSGSEGLPKGVVLSHRNILANVAQSLTTVPANAEDKVFNALPVFHSFGLTAGLIMPLSAGTPVYLYPSPLHYRIVPELIYQTNATIVFATDTFLNGYARSAHPYDFRSVRLILAGAEPVKQRTRDIYMEKFGARILEGYGVTETSPVLAINTPIHNKTGSVGRLSPLMEMRLDPVPGIEEGGRLFVRGPNVMLGYMKFDNPGVIEPPTGGWHDTGDIVVRDASGFLSIKGRAKRFAKIGGEMISLAAVEALAAETWPAAVPLVVSVPDPRKGERLILLSTDKTASRDQLLRAAKAKGMSELSVPAEIMLVDKIPLLGSGKADFQAAAALVREKLAARPVVSLVPPTTAAE
jgi:acyl-[acyl-carrier-protein]-phospholipid O-acyltransferase / long-chain-fatty-acid--[acyl-carrier-protein] ligase